MFLKNFLTFSVLRNFIFPKKYKNIILQTTQDVKYTHFDLHL